MSLEYWINRYFLYSIATVKEFQEYEIDFNKNIDRIDAIISFDLSYRILINKLKYRNSA